MTKTTVSKKVLEAAAREGRKLERSPIVKRTYMIKPNDTEIDDVRNKASEQEDKGGSKWPGMTYEQGVNAALDWVVGDNEENPMPDE